MACASRFTADQTKSRPAVAARHRVIRLRERTKQSFQFGRRDADAAVGDGEDEHRSFRAAPGFADTAKRNPPRAVNFTALSIRFSIIARSRTGSPATWSGRSRAIATSDFNPLVVARAPSAAPMVSARRRGENGSLPQHETRGIRPHRVADHGGELRQMLGRAFDAVRPAPLALAEIGGGEQFGQRENAGQRGADIVRERGERGFGRIAAFSAPDFFERGFAARALRFFACAPRLRFSLIQPEP